MKRYETEIEQENEQVEIPYFVHESDMARADRKNRRLWLTLNGLLLAISTVLIVGVIKCQNKAL